MLTLQEMATVLSVTPDCVKIWNRHGLLHGHPYNDRNECLYQASADNLPHKAQGHKLSQHGVAKEITSVSAKEVQCET
jgi:hypothetical protein